VDDMTDEVRFDGSIALITGAASGMGREYAMLLAKRGAHVIVHDNVVDTAHAVTAEITASVER
jgi:NAD(P)-dependent dehydrogenase (short-subunit alcohol dehydrogenase family)